MCGLDFSAILLNKRENLKICKITTAQGLDQIQSHCLKGLHLVTLKNSLRHLLTIPSLVSLQTLNKISLVSHTQISSPSGGYQSPRIIIRKKQQAYSHHWPNKDYNLLKCSDAEQQQVPLQTSVICNFIIFIMKSCYYNCPGWVAIKEHLLIQLQNKSKCRR